MITNFLLFVDVVNNFTKPTVLLALAFVVVALIFVFSARKLSAKYMAKKYPELDSQCAEYKEKYLNKTLLFKSLAAGIAIVALVLTLV